jgi:hypothetical protein
MNKDELVYETAVKEAKKSFEDYWEEYINERKVLFNARHKTRFGRWFGKPDFLLEGSVANMSFKFVAEEFFVRGQLNQSSKMLIDDQRRN